MSIYATLWELRFPADGIVARTADDWVDVYAQGVPAHIDYTGPLWEWLPPPVPDEEDTWKLRAVFICGPGTTKGTERNPQEYVDPLLVLTSEEYGRIRWVDLLDRISEALSARAAPRLLDPGTAGPATTIAAISLQNAASPCRHATGPLTGSAGGADVA